MAKAKTIKSNLRQILNFIGEDTNREGLLETPERIIKSWLKIFGGYNQRPEDVLKTFKDGACDSMVILKDVEFYSTCEHHMLPFIGKAHIAYIPNGRVVGLSKLARLLEIYTRRMQIQERIGEQVTKALIEYLNCKGAICVLEAKHTCVAARGVEKQNSVMVTSSIKGEFNDAVVRAEFMSLIRS